MTDYTAKIAFLHAAHNFAANPTPVNQRTLETAMQMHRDAMFPRVQVAEEQQRIAQVQALENERLGR